jgi:NAD(P)-dependent dehydrogenase (short-subunit alcohol dehydrogenase family)|tara:strand:- start:611 stop:1360 length:750 start_codon:yes stop_codon:yes gene_type:complete
MEEGLQTNKFNNLNIFITGASSGIGLAVSKLFLRMGSNVYAIDNNKMNDQEFMSNNNGNFFLSDICDYKNMNNIIKKVLQKVINIDILINCAGIIDFKSIEDSSYEFWKKIIDVNLNGSFITCKLIVPTMKINKKGSVINVSSRAAKYGGLNETAYCASKFGIEGFSRSLSEECKLYNIAVNSITPGIPIHTAMSNKTYSEEKKKIWKDPMSIAPAFLHLGMQDADGINNQYVDAWKLSEEIKNKYKIY